MGDFCLRFEVGVWGFLRFGLICRARLSLIVWVGFDRLVWLVVDGSVGFELRLGVPQ